MKDKVEEFIRDNKKSFEEKGPSAELWGRITTEMDKKKRPKLYPWISVAAILVLGFGIYFSAFNAKPDHVEVADINPVFAKRQVQFTSLIEEKKDSLQIYSADNPELYSKFITDIAKLDADYEDLKKQLQSSPNREAIVRAMMKNLEIRSGILSQQLNIINQVNQYKKENVI